LRHVAVLFASVGLVSCGSDDDSGIIGTPATTFNLTIGNGTGDGRVTSSDAKVDCRLTGGVASGTCRVSYATAAAITLTAAADAGQEFKAWTGDCSGSTPCQVTLKQETSVSPGFVPAQQTLDLDFQTPASDDGAAIISIAGPSVLDVVRTAGLELAQTATTSGATTTRTVLIRGNLASGTVAKVTVRGIHVGLPYTVRVVEVAARKSGGYVLRPSLTGYQASLR
jgi:hypothetical protein